MLTHTQLKHAQTLALNTPMTTGSCTSVVNPQKQTTPHESNPFDNMKRWTFGVSQRSNTNKHCNREMSNLRSMSWFFSKKVDSGCLKGSSGYITRVTGVLSQLLRVITGLYTHDSYRTAGRLVAPSLCSCTFLLTAILDNPTTKTYQGKPRCGRKGVAILGSLSQQPTENWGKRANWLFSLWGWPTLWSFQKWWAAHLKRT